MLAEDELEGAILHCSMLESLNIHSCNKVGLLRIHVRLFMLNKINLSLCNFC